MISTTATPLTSIPQNEPMKERLETLVNELRRWFDVEFDVVDGANGEVLHRGEQPCGDLELRSLLASQATGRTEPQFLFETNHVSMLAIALCAPNGQTWVAVATFTTQSLCSTSTMDLASSSDLLGLSRNDTHQWISGQKSWTPSELLKFATLFGEKHAAEFGASQQRRDIAKVSGDLTRTYEEISLLHRVAQNLRLSQSDEELCQLALDWLDECLPAQSIAIQLLPVSSADSSPTDERRLATKLLSKDDDKANEELCLNLIDHYADPTREIPLVLNARHAEQADWPFDDVHQLILTPLREADNLYGWLLAINHIDDDEFGSVEASLLSTLSAILGTHCGNHHLYRQQADLLSDVVRTLTSAIDAKDPYTCGHSERVARVATRIGRAMNLDAEALNTLYLGGLLHDIGKIGIDDNVLRKAGRLTPAEYEHIKLHPALGHKILTGLQQLSHVFPVVRSHHEQWDGNGYPDGLAKDEIPQLARIAAVADAYDAMTSDRPYRQGMESKRVREIFQRGSGEQWDPEVVDAFFASLDDIEEMTRQERRDRDLDAQQWI